MSNPTLKILLKEYEQKKLIAELELEKKNICERYLCELKNEKIILPAVRKGATHIWHQFVIRTNQRQELIDYLYDKGIGTIIHYPIPPHKQECYKEWNKLSYPITEEIHNTIISLPISPVMVEDEIIKVVEVINKY